MIYTEKSNNVLKIILIIKTFLSISSLPCLESCTLPTSHVTTAGNYLFYSSPYLDVDFTF